jgi:micrococcal nuclease
MRFLRRLVLIAAIPGLILAWQVVPSDLRHRASDAVFGAVDKAGIVKTGWLVRVVDGDTVRVRIGGREQVVRLVGIDTPESVRPGIAVECGAKAASAALRRLARPGAWVRVVSDPTQATVDRYGRRLGYVTLVDGPSLQLSQLRRGWADVYVYGHTPFVRVDAFRKPRSRPRMPPAASGACVAATSTRRPADDRGL